MNKMKRALPLFLVVSSVRMGDGRIQSDSGLRCNCGAGEQRQCSGSTSSCWWHYFLPYGHKPRAQHDVQHSVLRARCERRALRGQRRTMQRNQFALRREHARLACPMRLHAHVLMLLSTCCCPHAWLLAGRSVRQYPANQHMHSASSQSAFSGLAVASAQFSSVQFSSVVSYRLSITGYRLSVVGPQCCCPHAIRFGPRVSEHVRSPPSSM